MRNDAYISDMGLCVKAGNLNGAKIYGVMPYIAPEVLKGGLYIEASDVYSFGMIMYLVVTGEQPFVNEVHDEHLAIKICSGIRPEINEKEAPKCYIELMKKCLESDPKDRPNASEIYELISLFCRVCTGEHIGYIPALEMEDYEVKDQFKKAEKYRTSSEKNIVQSSADSICDTSRILDSFTKDLNKSLEYNFLSNFTVH